ncbi:MAG: response regulator, partial [Aestuariivirgaceae bacterium]
GTWKGLTENVNQLAENLTTQVRAIAEVATAVTKGDLTRSITVQAQGEVAALKDTINEMIRNLRDTTQKNTEQDWLKTNLAKFSRMLQGQKDLVAVSQMILSELAPVVGAHMAEFYVLDHSAEVPRLKLLASYASSGQAAHGKVLDLGMGLVGQCARDKQKILLADLSHNTLRISSGLIEAIPRAVLVLPVIFEGQVKGVIELGSLKRFNPTHQAFLDLLTESIGIVINTIEANMRTEELLKQSQSLANELQSRQRELQTTNRELQEKAQLLAHQNQEVERKNQEVEQARQALEEKAKQLALTSKYKSEFLANMSHELRTPLNSLLILSDQLCKNREGNLIPRQIEFARTIHASGNDLLTLINDILDLAKIESGTVVVDLSELLLKDLDVYVERTFRYVAEAKNVEFSIAVDDAVGPSLVTDSKRLQQILKNLLSNAFKFTHEGRVSLTIGPVTRGWSEDNEELNQSAKVIAFSVADSGIGISADKQQIIFEAFQQADGSTSRKYGGTGLGLAISRELSRLLGGEIRLMSRPGYGSTFTLFLPTMPSAARLARARSAALDAVPLVEARGRAPMLANQPIIVPAGAIRSDAQDDRGTIAAGERVLLIVENDHGFANVLLDIGRDRGFKGLVASSGAEAQSLIRRFNPTAMTLDIHLPDMEGWQILRQVKADIAFRHVPVCVISTDDARDQAMGAGAYSFLAKPVQSRDEVERALDNLVRFATVAQKALLIVSASAKLREAWRRALAGEDVTIVTASTPASALKRIQEIDYSGIVLDGALRLQPGDIARTLASGQRLEPLPLIVYQTREPIAADLWRSVSDRLTVWPVQTEAELQDQAALMLHRSVEQLPEDQRQSVVKLHKVDTPLEGKKVLIVDDDMRNIFALAALLEEHGMEITSADNGREALDILNNRADLDVVLMDIMMPEMDGIATMKAARKLSAGQRLPIIAVTAKAMKGDRERCIAAGASDYLSKPIDTAHLLHVLRSWLNS